MKIGVVFRQTEIGQDPAVIRDYAQAVESMGYTHMLASNSPMPDRAEAGAIVTGRGAPA